MDWRKERGKYSRGEEQCKEAQMELQGLGAGVWRESNDDSHFSSSR